jgi:phosphoserine phosphatase RsbU/P
VHEAGGSCRPIQHQRGTAISEHSASADDGEAARLAAVARYRVIGVPQDAVLTRMATLAARILDAPIATVSIIDDTYSWLTATCGLEDAPRFIPRDDGLCVDSVVRDGPAVVPDIAADPDFAHRPFVADHAIAFFACAPLTTFDGHRIGALAVYDTRARLLTGAQVEMLTDLAAIVMEQLELRLSLLDVVRNERLLRDAAEIARDNAEFAREDAEIDRDSAQRDRDSAQRDRDDAMRDLDIAERQRDTVEEYATVLQRTLLPPLLPQVPGLALAAHYHPASPRQVGGDFYDVFGLGGDRWAFFIGDVEGHGVDAAAVTSLIRYTLRSAALHYPRGAQVLSEVNDVLLREMQPRRLCTVLYGTAIPRDGGFDVELTTGGHQPGLLVDPAHGSATVVRSATGMLVGASPNAAFGTVDVRLEPGQILLLFTDGIVEARRGTSPFDVEQLADFAREHAGAGVQSLVHDLATLIPKLDPTDDVAILALGVV